MENKIKDFYYSIFRNNWKMYREDGIVFCDYYINSVVRGSKEPMRVFDWLKPYVIASE